MRFQDPIWLIKARGWFLETETNTTQFLVVSVVQFEDGRETARRANVWTLAVADSNRSTLVDPPPTVELSTKFQDCDSEVRGFSYDDWPSFALEIATNGSNPVPLALSVSSISRFSRQGILLAAGVLILLYALIVFEIIERTLASMIGATSAIACLTLIGSVSRDVTRLNPHTILRDPV